MRSYIISNIRNCARDIFLISTAAEYRVDIYKRGFDRSGIPEIMEALKNPTKPNENYPRFASILYRDGIIKGSHLFGSEAIINVIYFPLAFLSPTETFTRYSK